MGIPFSDRLAAIVFVAAAAVPASAQQGDRARVETLARRATDRLQTLQAEADQLASDERTLLGDLRRLDLDRQIKAETLRRLQAERRDVAAQLDANARRMQQLEQQDSATRPDLRARLVQIYKLGQGRYVRLLLSASDVRQMAQATRIVAALAKVDRDRVVAHEHVLEDLRRTRASLQTRSREVAALEADAARAQAALDRAAAARTDLVHDIDSRRDLNAQLAGELVLAQQKLQTTLRDLAAGSPAAQPPALPLAPFRGDLDWPAGGALVRRFGSAAADRAAADKGITIAAPEGSPASAVHDGTVAFAGPFSGFGNLVILDHGARTFTLYGDLLDIAVKAGDRVDRGQAVGSVGSAPGGASGLYFELRVDGQSVDPLQWLKKKR